MTKIVTVTLSINLGQHPAQGVESTTLLFDGFPTTSDIASAVEDTKWADLVEACEVAEIAEYQPDFVEASGFLSFECKNDDECIGSIILEEDEVLSSGGVQFPGE